MTDVKKYDLTRIFRHLYYDTPDTTKKNTIDKSITDVTTIDETITETNIDTPTQPMRVDPSKENSASTEEGEDVDNHFQKKTSRRGIILPSLRRSERLNQHGIDSQSALRSQLNNTYVL